MMRYVKKVLKLDDILATIADPRRLPDVPLPFILRSWFWGFAQGGRSTEEIGRFMQHPRWQQLCGLIWRTRQAMARRWDRFCSKTFGGPDTAARGLDEISAAAWNEAQLQAFFRARRVGLLGPGPFGQRCVVVDLNELYKGTKPHCPDCQKRNKKCKDRDGNEKIVEEYYHQAVVLLWAGEPLCFPLAWEVLKPGEGELTAAVRMLERTLPRLRGSVDLVLGDALYAARPFLQCVLKHGLHALVAYGGQRGQEQVGQTEMDREIELLKANEEPRLTLGPKRLAIWEMTSEAWRKDLVTKGQEQGEQGQLLRILELERRYEGKPGKHERSHLRVLTTMGADELPAGQCWQLGRGRWKVENEGFNHLTRCFSLTHNYRCCANLGLLVLRSMAMLAVAAYERFATARCKMAPKTTRAWIEDVIEDGFVLLLKGRRVWPAAKRQDTS